MKEIKLEIEELEERIAPALFLDLSGGNSDPGSPVNPGTDGTANDATPKENMNLGDDPFGTPSQHPSQIALNSDNVTTEPSNADGPWSAARNSPAIADKSTA
jgi:hypothetical protein